MTKFDPHSPDFYPSLELPHPNYKRSDDTENSKAIGELYHLTRAYHNFVAAMADYGQHMRIEASWDRIYTDNLEMYLELSVRDMEKFVAKNTGLPKPVRDSMRYLKDMTVVNELHLLVVNFISFCEFFDTQKLNDLKLEVETKFPEVRLARNSFAHFDERFRGKGQKGTINGPLIYQGSPGRVVITGGSGKQHVVEFSHDTLVFLREKCITAIEQPDLFREWFT